MRVEYTIDEVLKLIRKNNNLPNSADIVIGEKEYIGQRVTDLQMAIYKVMTHPRNNADRIPRIKMLRDVTGMGLKDAKYTTVDEYASYSSPEEFVEHCESKETFCYWQESHQEYKFIYTLAKAKKEVLRENLMEV